MRPSLRRGTATLLLASIMAFAVASFFFGKVVEAQETFKPKLVINIPTITFSTVQVQSANGEAGISGYIDVPWIGEYMKGIYGYAVGVAGLLAGVMVIVGGFYYLTAGGDASRVQKGKQRIADALIGLFLVFGAYMLLNTISPQLTTFESLHIKRIKQNPYQMIDDSVTTTHAATGAETSSSGVTGTLPPIPTEGGTVPTDTPLPQPNGNNYVQLYTTCPFTDLPPKHTTTCTGGFPSSMVCGDESPTGPRGTAFRDEMRALMANVTDMRRRIAMTAEAGVKCSTHYSSCGSTATTWQAIAGVGADTLGVNSPNSGGTTTWNHINHELPSAIVWQTFAIACGAVCAGSHFQQVCGARCEPATRPNGTVIADNYKVVNDCASGAAARAQARALIEGPGGPAGWPDSWTSGLEIGDFIIIYNGNNSCASSHAQIFLGWVGGGRAMVANGQWAGPQWENSVCLMRSCGNFEIVTKIFKPSILPH